MAVGWICAGAVAAVVVVQSAELRSARHKRSSGDQSSATTPRPAPPPTSGGTVTLRAGSHGHYFTAIEVNGRRINVMVDTGATMVALTHDDALRAGYVIRGGDYTKRVQTANGVARFAPITLDSVRLGDIVVHDVAAAVAEPGRLGTTLLGMSFLGRLQRVDMRSGIMVLAD